MHCPLYNIHRQQLVDSFNELNIEFTIQTILYGSETSDYNQNVKLFGNWANTENIRIGLVFAVLAQ
jgi:arginine/ornithine N-succinyltransferase beta subunit